jgi:hypothetical protein
MIFNAKLINRRNIGMKFLLLLVFGIYSLTSCNSTKKLRFSCKNCIKIENADLSQLNGNYSGELWKYLAPFKKNQELYHLIEEILKSQMKLLIY